MNDFARKNRLPSYLRTEQERIQAIARGYGLDFFPTAFEMASYDEMNELAALGGFPTRYPHWRFGMEYERLSKSSEYGLSRIYEMVINNNPAYAYLLEGNSLTDQRLVMAHVYGHVDFFKNNFCFRTTDEDGLGKTIDPTRQGGEYNPTRRWIDRFANHGARISRHVGRHGLDKVESFIDHCLSLENLIDPWHPYRGQAAPHEEREDEEPIEVPRLAAKDYMDKFINPEDYLAAKRKSMEAEREKKKGFPAEPLRDVLQFLLEHAPLERWERDVLAAIRTEAHYFVPQMQTKIMNEGWASYWHSRMMTEKVLTAAEIVDYADRNAGVLATSPGQLNPYKLGVELYRSIEERWDRGQYGREWDDCHSYDEKRNWDRKLGGGREKIFQVRSLYNDVTFIDEFLTPEFAEQHKLYTFGYSGKSGQWEIESRKFVEVKERLLFQLTNFGNPVIKIVDANFGNRGELLLAHDHQGVDLQKDYAQSALEALVRCWKRPAAVATTADKKSVLLRYDGKTHTEQPYTV
jgi:stage V sporulation protein R